MLSCNAFVDSVKKYLAKGRVTNAPDVSLIGIKSICRPWLRIALHNDVGILYDEVNSHITVKDLSVLRRLAVMDQSQTPSDKHKRVGNKLFLGMMEPNPVHDYDRELGDRTAVIVHYIREKQAKDPAYVLTEEEHKVITAFNEMSRRIAAANS